MPAMGSVWKRLQRVNKRAAKFQFTASYHELHVETTPKWRPSNLSVVWTRRSRRVISTPLPWEPDMTNPLVGHVIWPVPDNHVITVTLFKDPRTHEMEDKDWTFVLEDITPLGKKRALANASINMRQYASIQSTQQTFILNLKPVSRKITAAEIELTISCVFLMEGKATDEDMQSVVSLMSVNNNCDVAPLDDLEDIKDLETSADISDDLNDITYQLEQMTTSLNGCTNLPTPLSVPSLSEDATPLAEMSHLNFEQHARQQHDQNNAKETFNDNMVVKQLEGEAGALLDESLKTPNADTLLPSSTTITPSSASTTTTTTPQQENKRQTNDVVKFSVKSDQHTNKYFTPTSQKKEHNGSMGDANKLSIQETTTPARKCLLPLLDDKAQNEIVIKTNERKSINDDETSTLGMNASELISFIIKDSASSSAITQGTQHTKQQNHETDQTENNDKEKNAIEEKLKCDNSKSSADTAKLLSFLSLSSSTTKTTPRSPTTTIPAPAPSPSLTTATTFTKRSELQPLNLKKSYESIDNTQNQSIGESSTIISTTANATTEAITISTTAQNTKSLANGHVTVATGKPTEKITLKENTPGQDLLEWCKEVTKDYPNIMVTNLTTSWRNGMAFCAIIHHYQPDLIDMSQLRPENVEINCRLAFDVAESLGIPRVIEPRDMKLLKIPDKLAVITYLYQLKAHFTGEQLQIELLGSTSDESSYIIGNYKTDNLSSQNLLNLSHLKAHLLHQNSIDDDILGITDQKSQISPTAKKDVKNVMLEESKNILEKVLPSTKDKCNINTPQTPPSISPTSPIIEKNNYGNIDWNATAMKENTAKGNLHNNTQETQSNAITPTKTLDPLKTNEERQQRLRQQARRLILETRNKSLDSSRPTSPAETATTIATAAVTAAAATAKNNTVTTGTTIITATKHDISTMKHNNSSFTITNGIKTDDKYSVQSCSTITTIANNDEVTNIPKTSTTATISTTVTTKTSTTPTKKHNTPPCDNANTLTNHNNNNNNSDSSSNNNISNKSSPPSLSSHRLSERFINGTSPLQSFNAVMERISPKNEKKQPDKSSYIESELEALEREQEAIDKKASSLEKKLRAVMGGNPSNKHSYSRNPFIRLIRNSIGGGEKIRIKLLDLENDEFSLANSPGNSNTDSTSSSSTSEDEAQITQRRQLQSQEQQLQQQTSPLPTHDNTNDEEQLHNMRPIPPPRTRSSRIRKTRSKSCFNETTKHHHHHYNHHMLLDDNITNYSSQTHSTTTTLNSTSQPYTLLSSNSSDPSSCDNFQICSDEDGNVPLKVKRRHRRHRNNYSKPQSHRTNKKCNRQGPGSSGGGNGETEETEEQLLSQWFTLVNKKNALLRRQMQLNILEQESDLERKYAMLLQELRAASSVERWRKTKAQIEKEDLLLKDMLNVVNKRDELVQRLHNEEIAIEDDHEIARELEQVDIRGGKEKCVIQ